MDFALHFIFFAFPLFISYCSSMPLLPPSPHYGIHPQDMKYFNSDRIKCKDGSKSFTIDRLNDNFCDCIDGTDEPGTAACPNGKFHCRNQGSKPQLLFSSRVNDHLCDCCDGSDEYDGAVSCVDTCIRDANFSNIENDDIIGVVSSDTKAQKKLRSSLEDLVHKLKELKIVIVLEVGFIIMAFRLLRRHMRYKRRSYR